MASGPFAPPLLLAELARQLGREAEGDPDLAIAGVAALEDAGPSDLSFVRSKRFAAALARSKAGAVIAPPGFDVDGRPAIRSPNPGLDFARAVRRIRPAGPRSSGVHAAAWVDPAAAVDPSASLGPGCVVGAGARIGPGSVLHANVTLYADTRVGADCTLHAGCVLREGTRLGDRVVCQPGVVLGADGFGYVANEEGAYEGVPQLGRVVVEDDVEIGANATIDRGTLGETRIGRGTKLDNLVMVGHNCRVGEHVLVIAQAGLAGSVEVRRGALILPQAGISDHVVVGERAYVGPQSGVHSDVAAGARVLGTPQVDLGAARRIFAAWRRLPGLLRRVRALERRLGEDPAAGRGSDVRRGG